MTLPPSASDSSLGSAGGEMFTVNIPAVVLIFTTVESNLVQKSAHPWWLEAEKLTQVFYKFNCGTCSVVELPSITDEGRNG